MPARAYNGSDLARIGFYDDIKGTFLGTVIRSRARQANTCRQTADVGDRLSLPADCHLSLGLDRNGWSALATLECSSYW